MADSSQNAPRSAMSERDLGKKLLLGLGLLLQLCLMAAALWPTAWLVMRYAPSADSPGDWVWLILGAVLVFNYVYLLALLVLRILIPRPKEGFYPASPNASHGPTSEYRG